MASAPDTVMDEDDEDAAKATQNEKRQGSGTNQSPAVSSQPDNETYNAKSHNSVGQRIGLRTHDRHSSWKEVLATCHASEGGDHE